MKAKLIAEVEAKTSPIKTLDALNEAFLAWADLSYNRQVHSEIGEAPLSRWKAGLDRVEYADDEKLRLAFLWREHRTPDKAGIFSLFGTRYQVGSELARRRVEIRYDPEVCGELEVWHKGRFIERVQPFEVKRHRRPTAKPCKAPVVAPATPAAPVADWLGHLVKLRRAEAFVEPSPRALHLKQRQARMAQDQAIIDLLVEHLDPAVINIGACGEYLDRYGPFDAEQAEETLARLLIQLPNDQHVHLYLDAIRKDQHTEDR